MEIQLLGAAGEVTGSSYLLRAGGRSVLIDFGFFQGPGSNERNIVPPELDPAQLDAVLVTHAHLDHTGRLPLLMKHRYRGPIYATPATMELTRVLLKDSAYLQMEDAKRANRKTTGGPPLAPLYTLQDAEAVVARMSACSYGKTQEILPGIRLRMVDAGHILGSASIELVITEEGRAPKTIVFSGDLGPRGAPLLNDPVPFAKADLVFLESTYGDRNHQTLAKTLEEMVEVMKSAVSRKGPMLMPVFAIGRTQGMLYLLSGAFQNGSLPSFPLFLDSPMATEATRIYREHVELFDAEALQLIQSRQLERNLETLHICETADDSRRLNDLPGPFLVMAGSGMCTGGRILHHLRHHLPDASAHVLIVGYQGHGTLGRRLVERSATVFIHGQEVPVRAKIHTLNGFSAHAGQDDLLHWFETLAPNKPRVVLTHGEDQPRAILADMLRRRFNVAVERPGFKDVVTVE